MKKALLFAVIPVIMLGACNQNDTTETVKEDKSSTDEMLMHQALNRRDYPTALVSINRILATDSTRKQLYDTLFAIYNELQNPYAVADVGPLILKDRPNDLQILEPTAAAFEILGEFSLALELEDRLFAITGDPQLKLQIASNQFNQGNIEGAKASLEWVLDNRQQTDTVKVEQPMPTVPDKTQKIRIRAIAYYMLGNLYMQTNNRNKAKQSFEAALQIEPFYDMAATSLLELEKGR